MDSLEASLEEVLVVCKEVGERTKSGEGRKISQVLAHLSSS